MDLILLGMKAFPMKQKYTKLQIALEIIGLLLFVGIIAFVLTQWDQLPARIPSHYNAKGEIDSWGDKNVILHVSTISVFIYVLITLFSFLPGTWNIPVQTPEENKEKVYQYTMNLLVLVKVEFLTLFFCSIYYTATVQPEPILLVPVSLLVIFCTIICYFVKTSPLEKKRI